LAFRLSRKNGLGTGALSNDTEKTRTPQRKRNFSGKSKSTVASVNKGKQRRPAEASALPSKPLLPLFTDAMDCAAIKLYDFIKLSFINICFWQLYLYFFVIPCMIFVVMGTGGKIVPPAFLKMQAVRAAA